ncbi:malectin-A-like [Hydractinia symbiolongicarpus]|uniref:malectin-A-like n=1 Tax=Hydractinia symbiolongicarpus TaxID=13093 RepID=UPI00254D8BD2|nr:malectin-A-like [Hydractinia symbiolongicarpus]
MATSLLVSLLGRECSICNFLRFYLCIYLIFSKSYVECIGEVVYAVNCGGTGPHTDLNGVHYQTDKLSIGTASDYGKSLQIDRAAPSDQILYQTERYHVADFGYTIPIKDEGNFVLVLKFSEVYFRGSKMKVFDVRLNHQHVVIKDLDIYDRVGYGVAHDEYVPFSIKRGELQVGPHTSPFPGTLYVEFVKTYHDNPKINAIVIFKGKVEDVPRLQPLEQHAEEQQERDEEAEEEVPKDKKNRKTSGPKVQDPYELEDNTSYLYPVLIALGLFIPTVLCLCKL